MQEDFMNKDLMRLKRVLPKLKGKEILNIYQERYLEKLQFYQQYQIEKKTGVQPSVDQQIVQKPQKYYALHTLLNPENQDYGIPETEREETERDVPRPTPVKEIGVTKRVENKTTMVKIKRFASSERVPSKATISTEPQGNFVFKKKKSYQPVPMYIPKEISALTTAAEGFMSNHNTFLENSELTVSKADTRLMAFDTIVNPRVLRTRADRLNSFTQRADTQRTVYLTRGMGKSASTKVFPSLQNPENLQNKNENSGGYYFGTTMREKSTTKPPSRATVDLRKPSQKIKSLLFDGDYLTGFDSKKGTPHPAQCSIGDQHYSTSARII
jgi:hypothetical protein